VRLEAAKNTYDGASLQFRERAALHRRGVLRGDLRPETWKPATLRMTFLPTEPQLCFLYQDCDAGIFAMLAPTTLISLSPREASRKISSLTKSAIAVTMRPTPVGRVAFRDLRPSHHGLGADEDPAMPGGGRPSTLGKYFGGNPLR